MIYHSIKLPSGAVLYLPTSLPAHLHKFVDKNKREELEKFKRKVNENV